MPKPHLSLCLTTPDTVAECFDGVPFELARKLWDTTEHLTGISSYECEFPNDYQETNSVATVWHLFTEKEKVALNALCEARDAEWKRLGESLA